MKLGRILILSTLMMTAGATLVATPAAAWCGDWGLADFDQCVTRDENGDLVLARCATAPYSYALCE